jgi:hypothetical protein
MRCYSANSRSTNQKENDDNEAPGAESEAQQAAGNSSRALQHPEKLC